MNRHLSRLLPLCALLSSLALAQQPLPPPPPTASAPSEATREALRLSEEGCASESFDDRMCEQAQRQLEAAVRADPGQLEARLALARAYWNLAFREPEGSPESARLRQRSVAVYQQLIDAGVQDVRPYYSLSVLTRDEDARLQLLRRAVRLDPRHPEASKDLAWLLLARGHVDEAVRTYRNHLAVSPYRGREDGLDRIRFADRLATLGREREAVQVYEALWGATRGESRAERCVLFMSVDLARYERIAPALVARIREIRPACTGLGRMERAVELQGQGRNEAAMRELEQQIAENPLPAEPYLALERLYLKEGRVDDAARVVTRYFQREQDARERCRHYRTLSPRTVRAMAPALVEELERACRSPRQ